MKQKSVETLQNNLDGLISAYDVLIKGRSYNEALNVMKNVEIVIKQLQYLGITTIVEQSSSDVYYNGWYKTLKFFIQTEQSQLIKLDYSSNKQEMKHRGTGKTSTLLKLSSDMKIPILSDKNYYNSLRDKSSELNLNAFIIKDLKMLNMAQYRNNNIILVDEGTDISKVKDKIIIGFTR